MTGPFLYLLFDSWVFFGHLNLRKVDFLDLMLPGRVRSATLKRAQ